jgi:hypothetical protein
MYFPPYTQLLKATSNSKGTQTEGTVVLPLGMFKFLLQAALAAADFDEERYLAANPDIRNNLAKARELTPAQHFVGFGYFEGRRGGMPKVDEHWYLQTYPDVDQAVKRGDIASATEHFELAGAVEGRAPSKEYLDVAKQWKSLLHS